MLIAKIGAGYSGERDQKHAGDDRGEGDVDRCSGSANWIALSVVTTHLRLPSRTKECLCIGHATDLLYRHAAPRFDGSGPQNSAIDTPTAVATFSRLSWVGVVLFGVFDRFGSDLSHWITASGVTSQARARSDFDNPACSRHLRMR